MLKPLDGLVGKFGDVWMLVARVFVGLDLAFGHGWFKLTHFSMFQGMVSKAFPVAPVFAGLAVLAEVGGGLLLALGLWTRLAAAYIGLELALAFVMVHHGDLQQGGLALMFVAFCLAVMAHGPGRISVDGK